MAPCRSFALLICILIAALCPGLLSAIQPSTDQTALIQQMIEVLPPAGILDCQGASYLVTSLQLKSNMTIQNCYFQTTPGAVDFAAPVTVDGRSQPISNVVIRNVNVYGNRGGQTNIGYSGQENGGRHCFRILGYVSNLLVEHSTGSYCAGDGIAFISYGVSLSDNPAELPFQNIVVRNSSFTFNRRQGGSADGMNNATFENIIFSNNGTTIPGGLEGEQCNSAGVQCFGTGFWYEDYRTGTAGEGLNNITFSRCIFRDNFQRSLFFYSREQPSAGSYQPRAGIQILNSYLDAGAQPLAEDYAIQFQVEAPWMVRGRSFRTLLFKTLR